MNGTESVNELKDAVTHLKEEDTESAMGSSLPQSPQPSSNSNDCDKMGTGKLLMLQNAGELGYFL